MQASSQNATLNATQNATQESSLPEFQNVLLLPKEIDLIWTSKDPKTDLLVIWNRYLNTLGADFNLYSEYENWFELEEKLLLIEFTLQNLVHIKNDVKILDSYSVAILVNAFTSMLQLQNLRYSQYQHQETLLNNLRESIVQLFNAGKITRPQVKAVLDYAQRTIIRHINLFNACFSNKRVQNDKPIKISIPEHKHAGNLQTNCTEIIEVVPEDPNKLTQQDFYQQEEGQPDQQEDEDSDVDPDDPLYGLDQRLRNMDLDDESRKIIKHKLEEANNRIKGALEDRQKNLDSKLQADKGAKKK